MTDIKFCNGLADQGVRYAWEKQKLVGYIFIGMRMRIVNVKIEISLLDKQKPWKDASHVVSIEPWNLKRS